MHEKRIQLRWRDMDAYGHVNNAVYLNYLEDCRDEWVQKTLGRVGDTWDFVLARVAIDFRSELALDDGEIIVRCWLDGYGRSSVRTREEVRKLDGTIAAESGSVVVPRDPKSGKSRPLTEEECAVLDEELASGAA